MNLTQKHWQANTYFNPILPLMWIIIVLSSLFVIIYAQQFVLQSAVTADFLMHPDQPIIQPALDTWIRQFGHGIRDLFSATIILSFLWLFTIYRNQYTFAIKTISTPRTLLILLLIPIVDIGAAYIYLRELWQNLVPGQKWTSIQVWCLTIVGGIIAKYSSSQSMLSANTLEIVSSMTRDLMYNSNINSIQTNVSTILVHNTLVSLFSVISFGLWIYIVLHLSQGQMLLRKKQQLMEADRTRAHF